MAGCEQDAVTTRCGSAAAQCGKALPFRGRYLVSVLRLSLRTREREQTTESHRLSALCGGRAASALVSILFSSDDLDS